VADPGGALACRNCHTGNDPSRKFCRRCGAPLVHADLERLTWWQRFVRWLRGLFTRKPRTAGYRPRQRAAVRPVTVVLTGLLAVGLVVGFTPPLRERVVGGVLAGYNGIRDRMSKPVLVASRGPKASNSAKGAEPRFINDAGNDTYWAPAKTAPATGEWVEVELEKPARVVSIIITSGASVDRPKFLTQARPHDLDVTLRTKDGKTLTTPITLADTVGPQKFTVKGSDVKAIRLTIRTVYGGEPGRQVAVAELEIFVRS
jgi:hypothetical protein